jgi:hypothetical protein
LTVNAILQMVQAGFQVLTRPTFNDLIKTGLTMTL